MPDGDQERFEDYLDLERYIEELQAGHVAHPPKGLTPEQARIYRMAALFRSAAPEAATPRPEFVESLRARLLAMDQEHVEDDTEEDTLKIPIANKSAERTPAPTPPEPQEVPRQEAPRAQPQPPEAPPRAAKPERVRFVSRRSLLTGGAVAAASLAAGVGIGSVIEQSQGSKSGTAATTQYTGTPDATVPLVPNNIATAWNYVGTLAQLGDGVLRFATDTVAGFVVHIPKGGAWEEEEEEDQVIALSAACTHMGCLVQWQKNRQFLCPCHGGLFDQYGKPVNAAGHLKYMTPLPRMETKIVNGEIYVKVPKSNA